MVASAYKHIGVVMILFGMIMWSFMRTLAFGPIAFGIGLLASPLIIDFAFNFVRHANKGALEKWSGKYYLWSNQQIRIFEKDGCIWVVDEDLIKAAGMKLDNDLRRKLEISYAGYSTISGTRFRGFNELALQNFLSGKQQRNPEIIKLKLWFEREVFPPLRRKRGRVGRTENLPVLHHNAHVMPR